MNKPLTIVVLVFAAVIFISFFFPWISVETQLTGKVSRFFGGPKYASLKMISGFEVPLLANGPDAKLMISIVKVFNPAITDVDKKSWSVWGVPGSAVVFFMLVLLLGRNKWANLGLGILGAAIFAAAVFKIKTTKLDELVLNVAIAPGLWFILWSYLGIGIVNLISFYQSQFAKAK